MSLIIYSKSDSKNSLGIKSINDSIFKKLMYNEIHKKGRFVIPKSKLEKEFDTLINLDKDELDVILMTELSESQLNNYLETYEDETDNIEKYAEFLSIIKYNQINPEKFKIKKKLDLMLTLISDYWEDPINCNFTLTNKFINRRFNNSNYAGNNDVINNTVLRSGKSEIDWNSREINYLNDILRDNNWKEMSLKKYNLPKISSLTNNDILDIFNQLPTDYFKYNFICNMLCSRSHCHLILNSYDFLKISKPFFDKYKLIFKYLLGYSWLTLINEEYHLYNKITDSDRIIFDIDTANLLPVFPFTWDDINQNPYATVLIDKDVLDLKNNCLSLNMMRNYEKYYGVCNSQEFSRRLNIFVNGTNTKGILDHIDWSCCAITGSVMTACGMKYNPLFDTCKISNNMNELSDGDLANFFLHYYQDSDIDLICNKESIIDFIDVVSSFVEKLPKGKTTVENVHTATIVVSDDFIMNELENMQKVLKNDKINLEYVKSNFGSQDIKNYFYDKFYVSWKEEHNNNIKKLKKENNQLFKEYIRLTPREQFRIYNLDYKLDEDKMYMKDYEKYFYLNELYGLNETPNKLVAKLSESIRFKVRPPGAKTFEIFKTKDKNYFSTTSRFHMGFVRAIWNGKTAKFVPAYITSMMLQLAVDYKYFASIRDPIEIVNKYRSRGFGIILNDYEKLHMAYYNSVKGKNDENSKWIEMYKVNLKDKKSIENIFGVKKSSDDIFKPSKYFMGLPEDCYKNINHDTVSTFEECFNSLITPSLSSLSKYKAIGDNGKINPLAREVIAMGWNLLNPIQNSNQQIDLPKV
jgi:hypothetical protein